jgi:hypothetical protein
MTGHEIAPRQSVAKALGVAALGALAVGAVAIGAIAIGRLAVGKARVRHLEIDDQVVNKLTLPDRASDPDL